MIKYKHQHKSLMIMINDHIYHDNHIYHDINYHNCHENNDDDDKGLFALMTIWTYGWNVLPSFLLFLKIKSVKYSLVFTETYKKQIIFLIKESKKIKPYWRTCQWCADGYYRY